MSASSPTRRVRTIRALAGEDDEWHEDARRNSLHVIASQSKKPSYLILTKLGSFDQCFGVERLPANWGALGMYGIPCEEVATVARRLASIAGKLIFVGDLDPLDLTVFLEWRDRVDKRLRYCGVGDDWLNIMRRNRKSANNRASDSTGYPDIKMSAFENEHWARLKKLDPDVTEMIGAHANEILDNGRKIELEGAINPAFYGPHHRLEIGKLIFGKRLAQTRRADLA